MRATNLYGRPGLAASLTLALLCAGCANVTVPARAPDAVRAQPATDTATVEIARSSRRSEGEPLAPYWEAFRIPLKPATEYRYVNTDSGGALEARAERSASALQRVVDIDPAMHSVVEWRWRVDQTVDGADKRYADSEDSPARLIVAFEGDHGKLDFEERAMMRLAKTLTGREMPYATLMYVWSNLHPPETLLPSPRTSRVQMIVVEGGADRVGRWGNFRRDIAADFRRAFGEEPGRITAVGVMTDADNTQKSGRCLYGDITFRALDSPQI